MPNVILKKFHPLLEDSNRRGQMILPGQRVPQLWCHDWEDPLLGCTRLISEGIQNKQQKVIVLSPSELISIHTNSCRCNWPINWSKVLFWLRFLKLVDNFTQPSDRTLNIHSLIQVHLCCTGAPARTWCSVQATKAVEIKWIVLMMPAGKVHLSH